MFNLGFFEFSKLLDNESEVAIQIGDKKYLIGKEFGYDDLGRVRVTSYLLGDMEFKSKPEFLKYLDSQGIADSILVVKINGFTSYEEYKEDYEFTHADMKYLLNKYKNCNRFELCRTMLEGYHITADEADLIMQEHIDIDKKNLRLLYDKFKDSYELEPFDVLYVKIKDECKAFEGKYKDKYLKEEGFFDNGFIADHVGDDTNYSNPKEMFWHFYHTLGNEVDDEQLVTRMERKGQPFYPAEILDMPEYVGLADDLENIRLTFHTHCTSGTYVQIVYSFNLTDKTKAWLLQHKDDYDFNGELQDLAFYEGDRLRFSSCTHEHFHCDEK